MNLLTKIMIVGFLSLIANNVLGNDKVLYQGKKEITFEEAFNLLEDRWYEVTGADKLELYGDNVIVAYFDNEIIAFSFGEPIIKYKGSKDSNDRDDYTPWASYDKEDKYSLESAQESEANGFYGDAAYEYGKAGYFEDAKRCYTMKAEENVSKFEETGDIFPLSTAASSYEDAKLYDKAIEAYEICKKIAIDENKFSAAARIVSYINDVKIQKKLYEEKLNEN